MDEATWKEVDRYHGSLHARDEVMEGVLRACVEAGLPAIQVPASLGGLLMILARALGAKRVLEVGTLGGYSTIWLARGLGADGKVVTLEIDPKHARVARNNFDRAGVAQVVELREGPAAASLAAMERKGEGGFDLAFIDADKANIPVYMEAALRMTRVGGLIVVDNVVRGGAVLEAGGDESVRGVRTLNERLAREGRVAFTHVQTVGEKGYDGFAVVRVEG